jgi:hypothetical protein
MGEIAHVCLCVCVDSISFAAGNFRSAFLEKRRRGLEHFLETIAHLPELNMKFLVKWFQTETGDISVR